MRLPKLVPPDPNLVKNFIQPIFWGTEDATSVKQLAQTITDKLVPGVHFADNLMTWGRNNSMLDDGPFVTAWQDNLDHNPINEALIWRRYILACAAYHAAQLDGDFVECGCYRANAVKLVVDYLGGKEFSKIFWAYDRFEDTSDLLNHAMPEHSPGLYQQVLAKFDGHSNVRVIRGRIPDVFAGQSPDRIAYLHIDMNQVSAEVAALEALFDRVVPGGIVILDDYEWAMAYRVQKLAEDPWFEARSYRVFPLPTGQGFVIKR